MFRIDSISLPNVKTAFSYFGQKVKKLAIPHKKSKNTSNRGDEFTRSKSKPRTSEERTNTAVIKSNEANKLRLVAEINRSGEIDSTYEKLLPEYAAYTNPELENLAGSSDGTISTLYKKKSVEIKCTEFDNGNKYQEIIFDDGSQVNYIIFSYGGKMKINEEEFEMPVGTIVETKSVNGRMFSQLIQLPNMKRNIVNKPKYLDIAEQIANAAANEFSMKHNQIKHIHMDEFLELTKRT